jgi:hypothetical protein
MLRAVEKLPDGPDWVYEIKLDRVDVGCQLACSSIPDSF